MSFFLIKEVILNEERLLAFQEIWKILSLERTRMEGI